jgi:hypothetical protein
MARNPKTSRYRVGRCIHATKVMKLRLEGLTFREIGQRMGFSEVRAFNICKQELNRLNTIRAETCEQLQRLELSRLDEMWKGIWTKARRGDIGAQSACLRLMERRAKLLGLDAGDKAGVSGGQVVLNISEVVVNREALQSNGETRAVEDGTATPSPARLSHQ